MRRTSPFLGYSLNFQQTPAKREMDYLRIFGGSKESAKELKLFGLAHFWWAATRSSPNELHKQNVRLATRRLLVGALLTTSRNDRLLRHLCIRDLSNGDWVR